MLKELAPDIFTKNTFYDEIYAAQAIPMYAEQLKAAIPAIKDATLAGINFNFLGITEQIIFPEINIDEIDRIQGMNITFVTTAKTDEEGFALLKAFGLPFKNANKD